MRMDSILWKTSFKGAGDNVDGGDGYRRWQQVVVEIGEVRRGELVERCDEIVDEFPNIKNIAYEEDAESFLR
ncbi:hypothetical protein CDAR_318791 [Caerostris darwini]|uniref:Uncharacterized protein n=1 Tax=Caerostris darwini TaxID=1538125 RepID=A0AAV4WWX8_9ARAC|nr:hypothetical protein CDAR_318791 [Caerostris darwini]